MHQQSGGRSDGKATTADNIWKRRLIANKRTNRDDGPSDLADGEIAGLRALARIRADAIFRAIAGVLSAFQIAQTVAADGGVHRVRAALARHTQVERAIQAIVTPAVIRVAHAAASRRIAAFDGAIDPVVSAD